MIEANERLHASNWKWDWAITHLHIALLNVAELDITTLRKCCFDDCELDNAFQRGSNFAYMQPLDRFKWPMYTEKVSLEVRFWKYTLRSPSQQWVNPFKSYVSLRECYWCWVYSVKLNFTNAITFIQIWNLFLADFCMETRKYLHMHKYQNVLLL